MSDETKPDPPNLPAYVVDPLEKQSPEDLELIATYADVLADWKRVQREDDVAAKRAAEEVDEETIEELKQRGFETDPEAYEDVPPKAYLTSSSA